MANIDRDFTVVDKPAMEWMRENAPAAVRDLSDAEIVEYMGNAFRTHVCDALLQQWQRM